MSLMQRDISRNEGFSSPGRWPIVMQMASPAAPPVIAPPFDLDSARRKVKAAENAWNTRDPERVALAYTVDSEWRNRDEFFRGRDAIIAFLRRK